MSEPFLSFNMGNVATIAAVILGVVRLHKASAKEKDELLTKQVAMHEENKHELEMLKTFHQDQLGLNARRDRQFEQVQAQTAELQAQTRELAEMSRGLNRRLEMLENRQ